MYRPIGSVVLTRKSVSSLTQPIAGVYEARRMYANPNHEPPIGSTTEG